MASDIMRQVAIKYDFTLDDLRGRRRTAKHVTARIEAAKRMNRELGVPSTVISRLLCRAACAGHYWLKDEFRERKQAYSRKYKRAHA